jgi:hypothetical protein
MKLDPYSDFNPRFVVWISRYGKLASFSNQLQDFRHIGGRPVSLLPVVEARNPILVLWDLMIVDVHII